MRHINFEAVSKYNIPKGAFEWIRNHDWELDDGTMISPSLEDMFPFVDREEYEANMIKD